MADLYPSHRATRAPHWLIAVTLLCALAVMMVEPVAAFSAQVTDPDFLDEAGRIIGSPSAGPEPDNPGDRGGYAQFLTLAVMVGGVAFIGWRITRQVRR